MQKYWARSDALNAELRELVLQKSSESAGVQISNVGGWHSQKSLQDWPEACAQTLVKRIRTAVAELVDLTVPEPQEAHLQNWDLWAWANVNYKGHYNSGHIHQETHVWSGVYYVDAGDVDGEGEIVVQDRSGVPKEVVRCPNPFEREVTIKPRPGLMLIFPTTLFHHVKPYLGDGPRISIAFDLANPAFTIPVYDYARPFWWIPTPWIVHKLRTLKYRLGVRRKLRPVD